MRGCHAAGHSPRSVSCGVRPCKQTRHHRAAGSVLKPAAGGERGSAATPARYRRGQICGAMRPLHACCRMHGTRLASVLRFYHGPPWAISLGHHQSIDDIDTHAAPQTASTLSGGRPAAVQSFMRRTDLCVLHVHGRRSILNVYNDISGALVLGLQQLRRDPSHSRSRSRISGKSTVMPPPSPASPARPATKSPGREESCGPEENEYPEFQLSFITI